MKEKRIKQLEKELYFLKNDEIKKEIIENDMKLSDDKVNVRELANEIYLKRGIDTSKLKKSFMNNILININEMFKLFKDKDKQIKNKMIIEIIYMVILIIFMKIPFDLVRDIGYEYIELMTTNSMVFSLWNLIFLILYTITLICSFLILIRNFNKKYRDTN